MSVKTVSASAVEADDGYDEFASLVRERIAAVKTPVFTTDADPDELWRSYLGRLREDHRKIYDCHCCRRFLQKYATLVTIDAEGYTDPVLWNADCGVPAFFLDAVVTAERLVGAAKVTGVFLWPEAESVWGVPQTGDWTHLWGRPSENPKLKTLLSASQLMAEKKEDYGVLCRSLADYPQEVAVQALRVLRQDAVYRSEKAVGVAEWFFDLHTTLLELKGSRRSNSIWAAVATAPVGFCHVRSTVISTLLDDIKAGLDFDSISRRWKSKLNPLQYQRPTAPPAEGAIRAAEKAVADLGLERSFERRFATLADVLKFEWRPRPPEPESKSAGGFFDHLREQKTPQPLELPAAAVTWEKFARVVLPTALSMEVRVPSHGAFYGLVTAVHADAPPLLQWDGVAEVRNPVSWYFYAHGSSCSRWGPSAGWAAVTCVFLKPPRWQRPDLFGHQGDAVFFAVEGCRDSQAAGAGLALFPETLRSELHGVRSVIEAHSRGGSLVGAETGDANGLAFDSGKPVTLRVRSAEGPAVYTIDRWD